MKPYTLLVLGCFPEGDITTSTNCFQIVTLSLLDALKSFPHITVKTVDNYGHSLEIADSLRAQTQEYRDQFFQPLLDKLSPADLVLYIDWNRTDLLPLKKIREITGAKQIYSLLEVPIQHMDWCFCFVKYGTQPNHTVLGAPCNKNIYKNLPKKKRILVDHANGDLSNNNWRIQNGERDWTARISDWLLPLKDEYEVVRMLRFPKEEMLLKPHETAIGHQLFGNFLRLTDDCETFIVTHTESYGFGIIDMVARGIRILSPPDFLSPELVEKFNIQIFHDQKELLEIITKPSTQPFVGDKCISYETIAEVINHKFQEYLRDSRT